MRSTFSRLFSWSPPAPAPNAARGARSLDRLAGPAADRLRELRRGFDLSAWPRACRSAELLEALWLLDVLDRHVLAAAPHGPGLDIGSKNWSYLPALVAATPGNWLGVELAAHRRYWNLVTRRAVAERRARLFPSAEFRVGSLLEVTGPFGMVTWLLPFVFPGPHRKWGLPRDAFDPDGLLEHAWKCVDQGGILFVVNQGAQEAEEQERLFRAQGIAARPLGRIESVFPLYRKARFGWLARRR